MKILDVGCGKNKYKPGNPKDAVIGIDFSKDSDADIIHDLNKFPYPFKDNEFDLIICNHVLEHLNDLKSVMKELWRISKPNAKIEIHVPYFSTPGFFTDPTHKTPFTFRTLDYWDPKTKWGSYANKHYICLDVRFRILKKKLLFHLPLKILGVELIANIFPELFDQFLCYILPPGAIYFRLEVVK